MFDEASMQRRRLPIALYTAAAVTGAFLTLAVDDTLAATPQPAASQVKANAASAPVKLVDINSASKAELKTLPGIGDAEADRIIKARPYPSKAKLVVDKVISDQIYVGLQGKIVAAQPAPPKTKTPANAASKP
jgi:DNA uptake protein ComE-like DNA-binding protein